jgi:hypothetical protein
MLHRFDDGVSGNMLWVGYLNAKDDAVLVEVQDQAVS